MPTIHRVCIHALMAAIGFSLAIQLAPFGACAATNVITVGKEKQLFLDDLFIGYATNVSLRLHPARKTGERVLEADKPWETASLNWFSVLQAQGKFRMWYECYDVEGWPTTNDTSFCYAESVDGRHWTKPTLNLFPYHASRRNSIRAGRKICHSPTGPRFPSSHEPPPCSRQDGSRHRSRGRGTRSAPCHSLSFAGYQSMLKPQAHHRWFSKAAGVSAALTADLSEPGRERSGPRMHASRRRRQRKGALIASGPWKMSLSASAVTGGVHAEECRIDPARVVGDVERCRKSGNTIYARRTVWTAMLFHLDHGSVAHRQRSAGGRRVGAYVSDALRRVPALAFQHWSDSYRRFGNDSCGPCGSQGNTGVRVPGGNRRPIFGVR